MNILYLTTHLNVGGISSYLFTLAAGMKNRGHKVYIASGGGELTQKFISQGLDCIKIPIRTKQEFSPKVILSLFILLRSVKENDIHIIHSNTRVTQVLGSLLSRFSRKVHVSTCHGFFKARVCRRVFGCWGERVVAISQAVKEHLRQDFGVGGERIRVVYSGIDVNKFKAQGDKLREDIRRNFGLGPGPVIGIIARLSDVKGHRYLIEAMKKVLVDFADAQLFIIGEGRERERLTDLVRRLGVDKSIIFVPSVGDTSVALSVMDIFAMPSLNEGLGLGLMEAMASGLAVVGSDVGGIKNLIQDGYNGLLVKAGDADSLSLAILSLLKDKAKRTSLGGNAASFIARNFSQEKMVKETEGLYQECLKNAGH